MVLPPPSLELYLNVPLRFRRALAEDITFGKAVALEIQRNF